jgi:hypothetical protein
MLCFTGCLDTGCDLDLSSSKLGGGRCRIRRQCLLGGPPSMSSSTSMVDAAGPTDSAHRGPAIDIVIKTRWRTLSDQPTVPPRGPAIDIIFNTRWRMLSNPPASPPRGSAIDVIFKLDVGCYQTHRQHPPGGPTMDVIFKLGGGRCRTRRQRPQGPRHRRRLQPRWWTLLDLPAMPLRGLAINVIFKTRWWTLLDLLAAPPRGLTIDVIFKTQLWTLPDPPTAPQRARH